ncbi:hypothetical protein PC9H_005816 [Pleurotus ostreatus]|uniref:Uncharacterized protein n=1 Tax=Pleurotus ostreatus TaxID=5322 RepID=A0A8H6ZXT9_PLEOS|nr:uncharacterized protein PC9H_005816 [Pleurotus ostreatus]KAF7433850.1 hypothetical protein PC9H_005816 [Pleurotus ostreatus]
MGARGRFNCNGHRSDDCICNDLNDGHSISNNNDGNDGDVDDNGMTLRFYVSAVDRVGAGFVSSNTGSPQPPPLQEEPVAVEQLQGPHLPLPDPLIVQVPGAVQATTTVVPQAADVVDDGGYRAPTWTVTLQLSLTTSRNTNGALTSQ